MKEKEEQKVTPLFVEFNHNNYELVVGTAKDLRFIDLNNGKQTRIY